LALKLILRFSAVNIPQKQNLNIKVESSLWVTSTDWTGQTNGRTDCLCKL